MNCFNLFVTAIKFAKLFKILKFFEQMCYIEDENARLKEELKYTLEELSRVREENIQLKNQLQDPTVNIKPQAFGSSESTFITNGAANATVTCENW